jgi:hypothetical protein
MQIDCITGSVRSVFRHNGTAAETYLLIILGNPFYQPFYTKRAIINDGSLAPQPGIVLGNFNYTLIIGVYTDLLPDQCPEVTCPSGFCASSPQVTHTVLTYSC